MSEPRFQGWSDAALEFYAGLEADNSKAYWTEHRPTFDEQVNAPMLALVAELELRLGPGKVMRPYRDIRFTKDKSPYRTALGARVGDGYIQISARGLGAGCGYYHLMSDQLARYRSAVDSPESGSRLVDLIAEIEHRGVEISGTDPLKSAPRGYPLDHPRIELLRCKGLIAWKQWQPEPWLATPAVKTRILELFEQTAPLMGWLNAEVGPSTEPVRGRSV